MSECFVVGDYVHFESGVLDYHATVVGLRGDNCFVVVDFTTTPPPMEEDRYMTPEDCVATYNGLRCRMFGNPSNNARKVRRRAPSLHEELQTLWEPLLNNPASL